MSESEIEQLTEKYYNVVKECFETSRTWRDVIKKFPPQAIRSAVRRIVERFVKADEDLEIFDFCDFFTEQLPEFRSVEAFIEYLDKKGYIPPDPEEKFKEMLNYLEQQAGSLGYRLVKEEEWARVTGRWEHLRTEIERLRREKELLEARVKELEKALEEYKRTGRYRIAELTAEPVTATKKGKPPLPPPPPTRPKLIKEFMTYEEFVERIKTYMANEGLTPLVIERVIPEIETHIKEIYETKLMWEMTPELERIITYISNEYIPAKYITTPAPGLVKMGVNVREPQLTRISGMLVKPPISYIYPRFVDWANSLEKSGYKVKFEPVIATKGTHFIHEPGVRADDILVSLDKETNKIVLTSTPAISYYLDTVGKTLTWYRYPPCRLLLR